MTTTKRLVLQQEYNCRRSGEPDNWDWQDSSYKIRGNSRDEQIADAKRFVEGHYQSKFVRSWRIVERTTVTTDEQVETLQASERVNG